LQRKAASPPRRLFGAFVEMRPDEPLQYGTLGRRRSYNPFAIAFGGLGRADRGGAACRVGRTGIDDALRPACLIRLTPWGADGQRA